MIPHGRGRTSEVLVGALPIGGSEESRRLVSVAVAVTVPNHPAYEPGREVRDAGRAPSQTPPLFTLAGADGAPATAAPDTSAPVDHASRTGWGRTVRPPCANARADSTPAGEGVEPRIHRLEPLQDGLLELAVGHFGPIISQRSSRVRCIPRRNRSSPKASSGSGRSHLM